MIERKQNFMLKELVLAQYRKKLNYTNIDKIWMIKVYFIFKNEDKKIKEWYIHETISDWFRQQEVETRTTFVKFKKIIKKYKLKLTGEEEHNIFKLEERIFMTERALKKLDTDIPMKKDEYVYANFDIGRVFVDKKNLKPKFEFIKKKFEGEFSLTNKRFIFKTEKGIESFLFSKISEYSYTTYGFRFTIEKESYLIRIHDARSLNNIVNQLFRKKVKNVVKKRKIYKP